MRSPERGDRTHDVVRDGARAVQEYEPEIEDVVNISSNIWDVLHDGMRRVIQTHSQFDGLGVEVAGKTGTAPKDSYANANR